MMTVSDILSPFISFYSPLLSFVISISVFFYVCSFLSRLFLFEPKFDPKLEPVVVSFSLSDFLLDSFFFFYSLFGLIRHHNLTVRFLLLFGIETPVSDGYLPVRHFSSSFDWTLDKSDDFQDPSGHTFDHDLVTDRFCKDESIGHHEESPVWKYMIRRDSFSFTKFSELKKTLINFWMSELFVCVFNFLFGFLLVWFIARRGTPKL